MNISTCILTFFLILYIFFSLYVDILLFQEPLKGSKLSLDLDLFPDDPCTIGSNICDDPFISYRDDSLSSPSYCGTPESSLNLVKYHNKNLIQIGYI